MTDEKLEALLEMIGPSGWVKAAFFAEVVAELRACREVLRDREWGYRDEWGDEFCFVCHGMRPRENAREPVGHTPSCPLKARIP